MRKIYLLILVTLIVLAVQLIYYYRGIYQPPSSALHDLNVSLPISKTERYVEEITQGSGLVLIDKAHGNQFAPHELNTLLIRILSRGASFEFLSESSAFREKLREADVKALVIIAPADSYSKEDKKAVKDFVERGGKLLLIADPSRESEINSLASQFKMLFWNDYLYNLRENDGNYQYIYLTQFKPCEVTKKLEKIAFYTACSIYPSEMGIAIADQNTFSSRIETPSNLTPMVFMDEKILAIGDFTFLIEPYNSAWDNNQLISNIADFLTGVVEKVRSPAQPKIISWYNNKTKDNSTYISISSTEAIYFNATADQKIDIWVWTLNDQDINNNQDSFIYTFNQSGLFYINVSGSNLNGRTQTVSWCVNATIK
ncbi:MAG: hypothetical protein QXJ68_04445 [Methanocellales archaeon]